MPKRQTEQANLPELPLDALLSFLKDTRGTVNWSIKDLRDCLKLNGKQAEQVLAILEMQGYIARENDHWLTTAAGETVSNSKKPQFSADSVSQAMDILKDRIDAVNRDKRSEFKITKAVAFGDFLNKGAQVQAADVGVELSRRELSGDLDELEAKRQAFMKDFRRKSRMFNMQIYRPWMSRRSHLNLL